MACSTFNNKKDEDTDQKNLERLWGDQVTQLTPSIRKIILQALQKVRERKGEFGKH